MWRPPERVRHEARGGHWPSAAEAAGSRLFSAVQVGPVQLTQRTWVPAMVPWRASDDGFVTPDVLDWYECFARGRPGAIVVEASGGETLLFIQIIDFLTIRRRPDPARYFAQFLAITARHRSAFGWID